MRLRIARVFAQISPSLALFAVMLLALAPQNDAFWQCEGQKCGATPWACCCAAPDDHHDAICGAPTLSGNAQNAFLSAPACHCERVAQSDSPAQMRAFFSGAAPLFCALPVRFAFFKQTPALLEMPRPPVSRGPPRPFFVAAAPRRGPPAAPDFSTCQPKTRV